MTYPRLCLESDLAGLGALTFEPLCGGWSVESELYPGRRGVGATGRGALEDLLRMMRIVP